MDFLIEGFQQLSFAQVAMWFIGALLIYLAIKKDMEPTLLLPIGFGSILVNLPNSGAVDRFVKNALELVQRIEHRVQLRQYRHVAYFSAKELGKFQLLVKRTSCSAKLSNIVENKRFRPFPKPKQ